MIVTFWGVLTRLEQEEILPRLAVEEEAASLPGGPLGGPLGFSKGCLKGKCEDPPPFMPGSSGTAVNKVLSKVEECFFLKGCWNPSTATSAFVFFF